MNLNDGGGSPSWYFSLFDGGPLTDTAHAAKGREKKENRVGYRIKDKGGS